MPVLASVCGIVAPVVNYIVAIVYIAPVRREVVTIYSRMVDSGVAAVVISQKIMMERSIASAPDSTIAMGAFRVEAGLIKGFGYYTPLHGEISVGIK